MTLLQAIKSSVIRHYPEPICDHCATWVAQDTVIFAANRLEATDSPLCDCLEQDLHKYGHGCDCTAVIAAARILEGLTTTLHAEQCPACTQETPMPIPLDDFDLNDPEALRRLIEHGSHGLGERIIALETELQTARDTIARYEAHNTDQ